MNSKVSSTAMRSKQASKATLLDQWRTRTSLTRIVSSFSSPPPPTTTPQPQNTDPAQGSPRNPKPRSSSDVLSRVLTVLLAPTI